MSIPLLVPALLLAGTSPQMDAPPATAAVPVQAPAPALTLPVLDTSAQAAPPAEPVAEPAPPTAKPHHAKGDPLEGFNRHMFKFYLDLDRKIVRPVAMGYKHAVPSPVRSGVRNFFGNLREPIVFLNYLLQFKFGKAGETFGRFAINSTVGVGGLVDVAKKKGINLPHRPNGFGDTLGFYGVKPGPYLFLPIAGPTTLRDFLGGQGDALVLPLAVGSPFDRAEYQVPRAVLLGLDARVESDSDLKALFDSAVDPYATLRSVYLQNRVAEIQELKGKPSAKSANPLDDPLADPGAGEGRAPPPSTDPALADPLDDPAAVTPPAAAPHP